MFIEQMGGQAVVPINNDIGLNRNGIARHCFYWELPTVDFGCNVLNNSTRLTITRQGPFQN